MQPLHALTVTECCVDDLCAVAVMRDMDHTIQQGGAGGALYVHRYRAGGREECSARLADKMSDSRKRSSIWIN